MNRVTSGIGWARNPDGSPGYTWNPITGCLNGCSYCYARKLANGRLRERYLGNDNTAPLTAYFGCLKPSALKPADPFYPRFWPEKLDELLTKDIGRVKPKGIFTCDMSDLFGIGVPDDWTWRVIHRIKENPQHRFYLLTKQPQNLAKFSPFPDNCWVGVSAIHYDMFLAAMDELASIEAKVKFISFEPLLGWNNPYDVQVLQDTFEAQQLDWLIIGAQTKPYEPPNKIWVDEIIEASKRAGVPYFLKDNLKPVMGENLVQDMPK